MDVSIITVTWNSEKYITEQIRSVILGCENIQFEQIIIDNGSVDKTIEIIKGFPEVKFIVNDKNLGFGAANNQGVKLAGGRYFLFLNPDMKVEKGGLDKMISFMDNNPSVGLAGCKLVDEKGKINEEAKPRRFPSLFDQAVLILKIPHLFPSVLNKYLMKDFNPDIEQEVDSVRGSFMLVRREITDKLGQVFDPRYFIWFEDVDLCREVKKTGYRIIYTPIVSCVDFVGQAFKTQKGFYKQKMFTASMITYFKKWDSWYKWVILSVLRPIGLVLSWLKNI